MDPDKDAWTIVASGDQGYEEWQPMFGSIREVRDIISSLDQAKQPINMDQIISNFAYFSRLKEMDFPPLCSLSDFETLSEDFLHLIDEPYCDDIPGQSFNESRLYVDSQRREIVLAEVDQFLQHLRSLPCVRDLIQSLGLDGKNNN
jgi:hypothetical protein